MNVAALRPGCCTHCGTSLAGAPAIGDRFCCAGCAAAWEILRGADLGAYYDLRRNAGVEGLPVRPSGRSYAELDDPGLLDRLAPSDADGTRTIRLVLGGLHCYACVFVIEKGLARMAGVVAVRVDLTRGTMTLAWRPERVALSRLAGWLDRVGYRPQPWAEDARDAARRRADRWLWLRLGVAGAAWLNMMVMTVPLYAGLWTGIAAEYAAYFRAWALALAWPVYLFSAWPFHRAALAGLRARSLHLDLPISLGLTAAIAGSTWATVGGGGAIYYDAVAGLTFLLLCGRAVMVAGWRRAERAADALLALGAPVARRVDGDRVQEVPADRIVVGDVVEVLPGGAVPIDGIVCAGDALLDNRILTGESRPARVGPGAGVVAGATVLERALRLRATAVGADRRIARIAELAREAAARRAPVARLADRLAGAFTAVTLFSAAITCALWWWRADAATALTAAVSVAVVLCPCALGLATPLALAVAHGRAARRGVWVKGGDALEALAGVRTVVFDKTGTLTLGEPRVVGWTGMAVIDGRPLADRVAALAARSLHPVARALAQHGSAADIAVAELREQLGAGLEGRIGDDTWRVGSAAWCGGAPAAWLAEPAPVGGASRVFIARGAATVAAAWIADPLHPQALATVAALRARGRQPVILSGDRAEAVAAVAAAVGIARWHAEVSPEEKLRAVESMARSGGVAMVGDGANDAAALAAAQVGIAVSGSAEAALAAGDAYVVDGGLERVAELVATADATMRTIRWNVSVSVLYNLFGGALAAAGLIGPLGAALLMPISSLTVLAMSLRVSAGDGA